MAKKKFKLGKIIYIPIDPCGDCERICDKRQERKKSVISAVVNNIAKVGKDYIFTPRNRDDLKIAESKFGSQWFDTMDAAIEYNNK